MMCGNIKEEYGLGWEEAFQLTSTVHMALWVFSILQTSLEQDMIRLHGSILQMDLSGSLAEMDTLPLELRVSVSSSIGLSFHRNIAHDFILIVCGFQII